MAQVETTQKLITQELLFLNGNKIKDHGREIKDGATIRFSKLSLKGKTAWTQRVKTLAKAQLEEFPGAGSFKLEGCKVESPEQEGRGKKRKVAENGRCSARPPVGDFVQPLLVKHAKKHSTSQMPVLRIGMLSAGLREKFGHLCTVSV